MKKVQLLYEKEVEGITPDAYHETHWIKKYEWIRCNGEYTIFRIEDKVTGEINYRKKKPNKVTHKEKLRISDFIMITKQLSDARRKGELSYDEAAILYALTELIEYENTNTYDPDGRKINKLQFAKYINKDKDFVNRILNSLEEKKFIIVNKESRDHTIRINPLYVWKGKIEFN